MGNFQFRSVRIKRTIASLLVGLLILNTGCLRKCLKQAQTASEIEACREESKKRKRIVVLTIAGVLTAGAVYAAAKHDGGSGGGNSQTGSNQTANCQGCCSYHGGVRCYIPGGA